jgi:hypothetical protein
MKTKRQKMSNQPNLSANTGTNGATVARSPLSSEGAAVTGAPSKLSAVTDNTAPNGSVGKTPSTVGKATGGGGKGMSQAQKIILAGIELQTAAALLANAGKVRVTVANRKVPGGTPRRVLRIELPIDAGDCWQYSEGRLRYVGK